MNSAYLFSSSWRVNLSRRLNRFIRTSSTSSSFIAWVNRPPSASIDSKKSLPERNLLAYMQVYHLRHSMSVSSERATLAIATLMSPVSLTNKVLLMLRFCSFASWRKIQGTLEILPEHPPCRSLACTKYINYWCNRIDICEKSSHLHLRALLLVSVMKV